jgi:methylenetetrahydrofolate--tRNA-(uracil-5-)-methyltransferase
MDRGVFARSVTEAIASRPEIELVREEVREIPDSPDGYVVIATGPLTSPSLDAAIGRLLGTEDLYFYDSMAPIVEASSLDESRMYAPLALRQGRRRRLLELSAHARRVRGVRRRAARRRDGPVKDFEKGVYFEGCLPIEVMAERGRETLRHGPMKPMGLPDPRTGRIPWAVVQLRQDDLAREHYNIVGFQTKLKIPEQQRIFRRSPASRTPCSRATGCSTATRTSTRPRTSTASGGCAASRASSSPARSPASRDTSRARRPGSRSG